MRSMLHYHSIGVSSSGALRPLEKCLGLLLIFLSPDTLIATFRKMAIIGV